MNKIARVMLMRDRVGETGNYHSDGQEREHYNGRYAPMRGNDVGRVYSTRYDMDNRFRDRDGREHYDNGRYAPKNNMADADREGEPKMNTIGFDIDGEANLKPSTEYDPRRESYISFPRGDEVSSRHGDMQAGRGETKSAPVMTKDLAEKWVKSMQNSDGTTGEHWTLEQVKNLIKQRNLDVDPVKLWVAMNAEYSDRYAVNRKHGVDSLDFYLDSAIAFWLKDKDAVADKEAAYYTFVAK